MTTELPLALAPGLADPLATIVRSMNCYYSNLIEGHDTHPVDIERALRGELARKDITSIVDTEERQARRISAALIARGVLTAATSRAPLRMNITAEFAEHWFPRLFP